MWRAAGVTEFPEIWSHYYATAKRYIRGNEYVPLLKYRQRIGKRL
jgi:hypothetical protein